MHRPYMLPQVLGSQEWFRKTASATFIWTKLGIPGLSATVVFFSLMSQIVTGGDKALVLLTTGLQTFVGSLMSVHMFADSNFSLLLGYFRVTLIHTSIGMEDEM
jgi:hypothetical protein